MIICGTKKGSPGNQTVFSYGDGQRSLLEPFFLTVYSQGRGVWVSVGGLLLNCYRPVQRYKGVSLFTDFNWQGAFSLFLSI